MTASGTTNDNEWQRVVQRVTKSDNKWQQCQWVTTNDNEWQRMTDEWCDEWKQMRASKIEGFEFSKWNKWPILFLKNCIQYYMQYIASVYSAKQIIYKSGNSWHIFSR